jgi:anion-transporting  ArsA/GET3 family ATPase
MAKSTTKTAKVSKTQDTLSAAANCEVFEITTTAHLKEYLTDVLTKMQENKAAPIYGMMAINHALTVPGANELFDDENKILGRAVWQRITAAGFQLSDPPLLAV